MKTGMKIYLTSGNYVELRDAEAEQCEAVVRWFKDAADGQVITLNANGKAIHLQKRAVAEIEVGR